MIKAPNARVATRMFMERIFYLWCTNAWHQLQISNLLNGWSANMWEVLPPCIRMINSSNNSGDHTTKHAKAVIQHCVIYQSTI